MSQMFVIQTHHTTRHGNRIHQDLRLEDGMHFMSWAVPKGVPLVRGEKRLAVQVEDHPLSWGDFEGEIKEGYGKGTVEIYDSGVYDAIVHTPTTLLVRFGGNRVIGEYYLKHWKGKQWLIWAR
jgi:bifunctional non-homologous end joining protein LigD